MTPPVNSGGAASRGCTIASDGSRRTYLDALAPVLTHALAPEDVPRTGETRSLSPRSPPANQQCGSSPSPSAEDAGSPFTGDRASRRAERLPPDRAVDQPGPPDRPDKLTAAGNVAEKARPSGSATSVSEADEKSSAPPASTRGGDEKGERAAVNDDTHGDNLRHATLGEAALEASRAGDADEATTLARLAVLVADLQRDETSDLRLLLDLEKRVSKCSRPPTLNHGGDVRAEGAVLEANDRPSAPPASIRGKDEKGESPSASRPPTSTLGGELKRESPYTSRPPAEEAGGEIPTKAGGEFVPLASDAKGVPDWTSVASKSVRTADGHWSDVSGAPAGTDAHAPPAARPRRRRPRDRRRRGRPPRHLRTRKNEEATVRPPPTRPARPAPSPNALLCVTTRAPQEPLASTISRLEALVQSQTAVVARLTAQVARMEQRTETRRRAAKSRKQKRVNQQQAARDAKAEAWRNKHPSATSKAEDMIAQGLPTAVIDEAVDEALEKERKDAALQKAAKEEAANERRAESLRLEAEEKHRRYLERVQKDKLAEAARAEAAKDQQRTARTPEDLRRFARCVDLGIADIKIHGPSKLDCCGLGRSAPKNLWGSPLSRERNSWHRVARSDIARYYSAWSKDGHAINSHAGTTKWQWTRDVPDETWVFVRQILVSLRETGTIPVHENRQNWNAHRQYLAWKVLILCTSWMSQLQYGIDESY